jgi:glycosyltransferase involved in cell wall biosynthesis
MHVSVAVPLYNEEGNVERLLTELPASLEWNSHVDDYEIVCVNDGSTDRTGELLELYRSDPVKIVTLHANSGQSAALAAGIAAATHDTVARIDADLQTTPDDLAPLLAMMKSGFDCAHGIRAHRRDPLTRRVSSAVANVVRRAVLHDAFRDIGCPLTVFRKECVERIPLFPAFHRYLPYLIEVQGYRVAQVAVRHFPRLAGSTKYGVRNRLWIGVLSLLFVRSLLRRITGSHSRTSAPPP